MKKLKTFGSRLNALLREKNIMKKEFAIDIGVSVQTVSNWISGKVTPDHERLKTIAKYFGVELGFLTCEIDFKNKEEMIEHYIEQYEEQDTAKFYFLKSFGYTFRETDIYYINGEYIKEKDIPTNELCFYTEDIVYEVTTEKDKKYYFRGEDLFHLVNDFFVLLKSKLIQKEVSETWFLNDKN